MSKTKTAVVAGVVVAAVVAAVLLQEASARVIIIKDGTIEFYPVDSNLKPAHPPQGQGKKYKWSARASRVAVWRCDQEGRVTPVPFSLVVIKVPGTTSHAGIDLHFQNEGNKLHTSFGDGYSITWTPGGHRLRRDADQNYTDLRIGSVLVDGTETSFDGDGCVAFHESEQDEPVPE